MAKRSQIQVALDQIEAEIQQLEAVRDRLKAAAFRVEPKRKPLKAASKRRLSGEGATTDSGNMNYPPA
jgi:hypothetical protein